MRFQLKNIGVISEADILLDNITLIAAENDSGKSTIGKALFTLINTMNYFEDEYILNVTNIIDGVYSSLNNLLQVKEKNYKNERIKEILENNYITKIELDGLKKELFLKLDDVVRNRERSNIFVDDSILKKVTLNVKKLSEYSDKDNEIKELLSLEKTLKELKK